MNRMVKKGVQEGRWPEKFASRYAEKKNRKNYFSFLSQFLQCHPVSILHLCPSKDQASYSEISIYD